MTPCESCTLAHHHVVSTMNSRRAALTIYINEKWSFPTSITVIPTQTQMRHLVGILSLLLAIYTQASAESQLRPAIYRSANKSIGSKTIRGLLRTRQVSCSPGYGYCARTGVCCPAGGDCCADGQSSPTFMYNDDPTTRLTPTKVIAVTLVNGVVPQDVSAHTMDTALIRVLIVCILIDCCFTTQDSCQSTHCCNKGEVCCISTCVWVSSRFVPELFVVRWRMLFLWVRIGVFSRV